MSLALYNQKRIFSKTPEPAGRPANEKQKRFVIQKHKATRLHYDLRFEAGGVLKSWAVPKGPSLDARDKRLAMMVEDHPLEYRKFEGVIPKGNYGAGNVIIWDEGYYESDESLSKQIERGNIKIRIFGRKLSGKWELVRIKGDKENAWLLIKVRDGYEKDYDITSEDKSVVSGQTIDEIGDVDLDKILKTTPKENPPDFISPMLASLIDNPFDSEEYFFEIKWDGYRMIADKRKGNIRLYSRNRKQFNDYYPLIVGAMSKVKRDVVIDGEVVILDKQGKPSFQALQNYPKTRQGTIVYYAFDLIFLDGHNLSELPLKKRKKILAKILPPSEIIRYSDHIESDGVKFYKVAKNQGLEGIIGKRKDSSYRQAVRSRDWVKIKTRLSQEAVICGFTEPRSGGKHIGALILGLYENGKLKYIGHTGSGMSQATIKDLYMRLTALRRKKSPFENTPKTNMPATWVKPELVCEVSFQEWTDEGHMRMPIFEGLREDKKIENVIVEKPLEAETIKKNESRVSISNPDKIFWPKEGYTKKDLIDYYRRVADFILPYIRERPESLKRYPDGIDGKSFFQKDVDYKIPDFVDSFRVRSNTEGREINYLVVNNADALTYILNLGCIDINPWNSRVQNPDYPDYMIFDLDPLEIGFEAAVKAANAIRSVLEEIGIHSYPKTSGATGIHVYVPTAAQYTYSQVRQFSELIVNIVAKQIAGIASIARSPSKRKGKVYLDFLQNRIGQTLAAPYCVRPRPAAPVSTPLLWEEVTTRIRPEDFTMKNTFARLDKYGDLWKPVLERGFDMKKALDMISRRFSGAIPSQA